MMIFLSQKMSMKKIGVIYFDKMGTLHSGIINAFKDVRIVILKRVTE